MPHSSAQLKGPLYVSSMHYTVPSIQNASFLGPQFSPKSYPVLPVNIFQFSPTEYELLLWAQQCFFVCLFLSEAIIFLSFESCEFKYMLYFPLGL